MFKQTFGNECIVQYEKGKNMKWKFETNNGNSIHVSVSVANPIYNTQHDCMTQYIYLFYSANAIYV